MDGRTEKCLWGKRRKIGGRKENVWTDKSGNNYGRETYETQLRITLHITVIRVLEVNIQPFYSCCLVNFLKQMMLSKLILTHFRKIHEFETWVRYVVLTCIRLESEVRKLDTISINIFYTSTYSLYLFFFQ